VGQAVRDRLNRRAGDAHQGDVLWSKGGKLFRLAGPTRRGLDIDAEPKFVADLNAMTFEAIEAPKSALRWP
jgi:hypothetical protein